MRRLRTIGLLGAVVAVALAAGWLLLAPDRQRLPTGSSYSTQPDGTAALVAWADAVGVPTRRLLEPDMPASSVPATLLLVQPELPVTRADRRAFEAVPGHGGTLVLAGDSVPLRSLATALGVGVDPTEVVTAATVVETGAAVSMQASARVGAPDARPLLVAPNGDWLALRRPYLDGSLVVFSTPYPLTTAGLRDPELARLVYRTVLAGAAPTQGPAAPTPGPAAGLALDEAHHTYRPPSEAAAEPGFADLVLSSAPGRALVYAAGVVFLYLLLGGRRLGPPLPPVTAGALQRTMFEHVQTLAGLYRRARQLPFVREHYALHYARRARARPEASERRRHELAAALAGIRAARTERQLLDAVQVADRLLSRPP
jgi:Domain of unknown function (DUF4350)